VRSVAGASLSAVVARLDRATQYAALLGEFTDVSGILDHPVKCLARTDD